MEHCHDWRQLYIYNYTTSWEEGRQYRIFLIYEADVSVQDCQNALEKVQENYVSKISPVMRFCPVVKTHPL